MAALRRRAGVQRAMQRRTTWARQVVPFDLTGASDFETVDLLAAFKADGGVQQGVTVTRIHLNLAVVSDVAQADEFYWGILRGQNTDIGLNIAGAPTPAADPYDDWIMWRSEWASYNGASGVGAYFPGGGNSWNWDLKGQRRLEELQMTLNMIVQRVSTASDLSLQAVTSVLLKLPWASR